MASKWSIAKSNGGSAPVLTKVTNGEETLTLLKAWKKGVVIKVRGALFEFPSRLHVVWPQNPNVPKSIYISVVAPICQCASASQWSSLPRLPDGPRTASRSRLRDMHRGHGRPSTTNKLAALIKAKSLNGEGGLRRHNGIWWWCERSSRPNGGSSMSITLITMHFSGTKRSTHTWRKKLLFLRQHWHDYLVKVVV